MDSSYFRNYSVGRPKAVLHFQCGLISQVLYYSLCIRNLSFSPSVLLCWKKIPFSVFCSNRGHLKCDDLFFTASKSDRSNGGGNSKESKNRRVEMRDSVILDLRPYNPLTSHLLSQSYIYPASNGLTQTDRGMCALTMELASFSKFNKMEILYFIVTFPLFKI